MNMLLIDTTDQKFNNRVRMCEKTNEDERGMQKLHMDLSLTRNTP